MPAPSAAKRQPEGDRIVRASRSAQSASPVAKTASLDAWWYSVANAG